MGISFLPMGMLFICQREIKLHVKQRFKILVMATLTSDLFEWIDYVQYTSPVHKVCCSVCPGQV
jgi:hypothetical protein